MIILINTQDCIGFNTNFLFIFAEPEEISNSVTAVCSDLFSFMTGQIIRIDGGLSNIR